MLQEARARWLGELAVMESKLSLVRRPVKGEQTRQGCKRHEQRGSANLRCKKLNSQGLADPARLKEARAWWLGVLAVKESILALVSTLGKVARGTSEVARRTCGARKKVNSHGLSNPARLQEARARWLGELAVQTKQCCKRHERGGSANLRCRKVSWHGLADRARLQEERAKWPGELAVQEIKLARVCRPSNVATTTSETRQGCKRHERSVSVNLRCKKLNSHGLADQAMLQEARARWLGELAVQESKLARVSRPSNVARGTSEVAWRTCGDGKKVSSHGLADPARLQEAQTRWLGELAVQESKLARVSKPGEVARGTSDVAQ
ncbi:hypothetical protein CRG98_042319 [Punica granatum]|uniref:Uncharacterized protein n=1 Tax=Punica granatum TaxID=22663 RepID=A0A2I0I016_PUNGR|nr:hypothetical protein CRG98_042319 [Punica granatum]